MVRGVPCDECRKRCKVLRHKPKEQWPLVSRFFKLMFAEDYTQVLYLPPAFARTVQHLVGQETQIEDVDGKQWSVTLSKVKGSLAFQKGWPKFYQDHDLKLGELVMFKYIKGSHFFVRIYGISACERINFNSEIPRRNKRPRRVQLTPSEDEPIQTADVNSGGKPPSATSADVGFELQTRETNLAVITAEPMIMEDPACMIIRDDANYQREDRNFLDLSSFEMQNVISNPSTYQKLLNFCPSSDDPEQAKTTGDNAQTGVVQESPVKGHSGNMFTDKLEMIELMDQMKDRSCGILSFKSEKALETKIVPSDTEITKQVIKNGDTQKAVTHSSGHFKKRSENRNSSKCIVDDVSNGQNGTGKHAEEVHVGKNRAHESSVSSSVAKEPFGKHAIKTERVEFGGKEPAVFSINDQIFALEVKVEPDQSCEMGPPDTISPFSAEVKSKAYLELPSEFPSLRGKRERGRGKVVYLKDSIERVLPVFYPDTAGFKALTVNWATFCRDNNVNLGDECRFYQVEDDAHCVFRVDVIRRSPNE